MSDRYVGLRRSSRQTRRLPAVIAGTLAALVLVTGALSLSHQPAPQTTPVDLVLPIGAPTEVGQWCVDHNTAEFRATLTTAGKNLLKGCVELWGIGLVPSPSPSSSPTPTPSATQSPSPSPPPTASPSPTPSPTATTPPATTPPATTPPPSPSPTVTPSPTPTPSPTIGPPGRTCAAFPSMPDASCTGVPAGVVLHSCGYFISTSGTYDSCLFSGGVSIDAKNVTITRSRVLGRVDGTTQYDETRNLKLVDVEIDGGTSIDPNGQAAIGQDGWSCLRCYVHRTGRGANAGTNVSIVDSYFIDFGSVSSAHITAVGSNGGQHSKLVHSSLTCNVMAGKAGGCSAAFSLYGDFSPIDDWLVTQNLLASPQNGFCTYAGSDPTLQKPYPHGTHIQYLSNLFGSCPQYGAVYGFEASGVGNVWLGNAWVGGGTVNP